MGGKGGSPGTREEATTLVQAADDGMNQVEAEEERGSRWVLKAEGTGFTERLDVRPKNKEDLKDIRRDHIWKPGGLWQYPSQALSLPVSKIRLI